MSVQFLEPIRAGKITARAEVRKCGKRLAVVEAEATDEQRRGAGDRHRHARHPQTEARAARARAGSFVMTPSTPIRRQAASAAGSSTVQTFTM